MYGSFKDGMDGLGSKSARPQVGHALTTLVMLFLLSSPAKGAEVCFTPGGQCADLIAAEVDSAKNRVLVQAYGFTNTKIIEALGRAKDRGVDVRVLVDKGWKPVDLGFEVRVDDHHAIAHNKVMIIDSVKVITGSFNFTEAAQKRNAENVLVVGDADLAWQYEQNWLRHWQE